MRTLKTTKSVTPSKLQEVSKEKRKTVTIDADNNQQKNSKSMKTMLNSNIT